jgi:hypothetical protein
MWTVKEFIDNLDGILFEIWDTENKVVYSDFLDDQYLENYLEYHIASVSMEKDYLVIHLIDYTETPQSRCAVGQRWWMTLPPAMGEEIGGLVPCEIVETEFGSWEGLVKVTPLRKSEQWGYTPRIMGYEMTLSRDRLTEQIIEE